MATPAVLHPYYTIDLDKERFCHKASAYFYEFVAVASIVATVVASFFLFSAAIDSIMYIPYISVAAIAAYHTNHKKYKAEMREVKKIDAIVAKNKPLVEARYLVEKQIFEKRIKKLEERKNRYIDAPDIAKIQRFHKAKEKLFAGLQELHLIHYVMRHPKVSDDLVEISIPQGHQHLIRRAEAITIIV